MNFLNKHIKLLSMVLVLPLIFISCAEDDKNQLNDFSTEGGFVRFVDQNPPTVVGVNAVSEVTFSFGLEDANNNAASYDLSLYADNNGVRTDTVLVAQITEFPTNLSFTINDFETLLSVDEFNFGDQFFFSGVVTTVDGQVFSGAQRLGFDDLDDDDPSTFLLQGGGVTDDLLDEAGYRQAYEFNFTIACPSINDTSSFAGIYDVLSHTYSGFGFPTETDIQVVSGPNPNQLTIVGGIYSALGSEDLILDVDLNTGVSTVSSASVGAAAWNAFGLNALYSSDGGTGLSLECGDPQQIGFNLETDCCVGNNVVMVKTSSE